jgi:histidinol-phosphate aminotransferase
MSVASLARPEIRKLQPYKAAMQVDNTVRLNANEAPWNSSGDRFRRPLNRYPEIRPARLQDQLSLRFGCEPDQLLVTRGSSEAIDLLLRAFCRAGVDNIVTISPSFSMYSHYAEIQGAEVREVALPRDRDFDVDTNAILAACDDRTRLVFVCTPNNPTGTTVSRDKIVELLQSRRDKSVIIVDEAYIEFSDASSCTDMLDAHDNLVVLRTLSKALAFAGVRCGAVMGNIQVIGMLNAIQAPYALATPVVECVENALQADQLEQAAKGVALIVEERERVTDALGAHELVEKIWPSSANFFLMQVNNAEAVVTACEERKILLRYFGGSLADCIRVTIGSPEENDRLLGAFDSLPGARS